MKRVLVVLVVLCSVACGRSPKTLVVTDQNIATFEQVVGRSDRVSTDEKALVERFMKRRREEQAAGALSKAFGVDAKITADPVGKTVQAIIEEQRAFEVAAAAERARAEAVRRSLSAALDVNLVAVGPRTKYGVWLVDIELECRNVGKTPIRAFKGTLSTSSLMGDTLKDFVVSDEVGLAPGETRRVSQSGYGGEKFAAVLDPKDLRWTWEPTAILFEGERMVSTESSPAPKE